MSLPRIGLLAVMALGRLAAQDSPALAAWQRGDLAAAQAEFERGAEASSAPGLLLYNAGLCAQRRREFARARWLWLRAVPCLPRDADLQARLREVDDVLGSVDWTQPTSGPMRWLGQLHQAELLWATVALQLLGWAGHFLGRGRLVRSVGRALLAVGLLLAACLIWQQWGRPSRAVIAADELAVRAAPMDSAAAAFTLRAGELVELGPLTGSWRAVQHPRGRGFVSAGLLVIE